MQSVRNNRPKESFVEKAKVMIKMIKRMVCFSCAFFNFLYDTINLDSSGVRTTSITLYIISRVSTKTRFTILGWGMIRITPLVKDNLKQLSENEPDLEKEPCDPPEHEDSGRGWQNKNQESWMVLLEISKT